MRKLSALVLTFFLFASATNAALTVTSVNPNSGIATGGNVVTISGTDLLGVDNIDFNGSAATIQPSGRTNTQMTVVVPNAYTWGAVDVSLSNSSSGEYVTRTSGYTYLAPVINTVTPNQGSVVGGTAVTISGSHFAEITNVYFDTYYVATSFTVVNSTTITAVTPASGSGAVPVGVQIETAAGTVDKPNAFTYTTAVVGSVVPASGSVAGGTNVTITGTGLNAVLTVYIGGINAPISTHTDTSIVVTTPAMDAGIWPITFDLTTYEPLDPGRTFTYTNPVINSVLPSSGTVAGGTSVTLSGTGLDAVDAVYIGGSDAPIISKTNTTIVVITPVNIAGPHNIELYLNSMAAPLNTGQAFIYTIPVINTVLPASGPVAGGTSVTLSGTGLNAVDAVYIGGSDAPITSKTDTAVVVTAPVNSAGAHNIELYLNSMAATIVSGQTFTYLTAQITNVTPTQLSSLGGETVVITGANFTGVQDVIIGGNTPGSFTINSDTQVTLITPAYITGAATVDLYMADNTVVTSAQSVTFNPPQITAFNPSQGAAIGGTSVTVTGSYFTSAINTLQMNAGNASNLQFVNNNTLTLTTPAGSVGNSNVWMQASTGASYFFNNVFTYLAPPTLSNVSPNSTDVNGGISVTITGNNFSQGMSASIAGFSLYNVTYINATTLTATVPSLPEGIQSITVTNTSGETVTLAGAFLVRPSAVFKAGDLAPLNNPDGVLNVADVLILQRMVNGLVTPTTLQQLVGDVAPLGNPDGVLNVADVLVLQRGALNLVTLPAAIENKPPQISIVSPVDSGYVNATSVTLIGLLNEQGIVTVNGVAVPVDAMLTFTKNIAVNEGSNSIAISATDIYGNTSTRNVTVYRDTKPPAALDINRITFTTAAGSTTITGSAGSAEANATVNVQIGTQHYTTTANTNGAFSMQVTASNGTLLQLRVSDNADNTSTTLGYTVGTTLQILSPLANSTIADNKTNIVGVYAGEANSGVSVNGSVTCTYNNHFYINNFPLTIDSNTLTTLYTTQTGSTQSYARAVTGSAASAYALTADNNCGMAPLTVNFTLTGSGITQLASQLDIDYDSNGTIDFTSTTPATATLQHIYTTPGVYPVTAWVRANNLVYTLTLNIVVQDPDQQTDQLKVLFNTMRTALISGDKTAAMRALSSEAQNTYGGVFDALLPHMAEIFGELSNSESVSNGSDYASQAIIRLENGEIKTYTIIFIKDNDGVWRIDSM